MQTALLALLLATAPAAAPTLEQGTQLRFKGSMEAVKIEANDARKSFELTVVVAETTEDGLSLLWVLSEKGRGGWPWTEQFGLWELNGLGQRKTENGGPSLLYLREEGASVVPLITPLFKSKQEFATGVTWKAGKLSHRVLGTRRIGERPVWSIAVSTPYGHKRNLAVDQKNSVVTQLEETVFIGQGHQHTLKWELTSSSKLNEDQLQNLLGQFESLTQLRQQLEVRPGSKSIQWNSDQLALLKKNLPGIWKRASEGPLASVVETASRDNENQKNQAKTVTMIRKSILGQRPDQFILESLGGKKINNQNLKGKVTVLHFWQYRDRPLQEPYGQIGFLDYLNRKYESDNIQIYGVTVDERLSDKNQRGKAIASARKLKSFMNLSYPVMLDAGEVIKTFGDPRVAGAKLPLYVVVDPKGKVVHYHAGLYEVDRVRGLKELDEVIKKAVDTGE